MIELHRDNTAAMLALRQSTDERFHDGMEQMQNIGQCYRALLQTNGKAVTQINHTVRWNINKTEIMRSKLDFIIEHMRAEYQEEQRHA